MELTKIVLEHKKTIRFEWCKRDFMLMSPEYRLVRTRCRTPMDACGWCKYKFSDGEMMALAAPEKKRNMVLCQKCAEMMTLNPVGYL